MSRWLLSLSLVALASCTAASSSTYESSELDEGEGYVAFRLGTTEMLTDPDAIFVVGFRLHYRPIESRMLKALFSSTPLGAHIKVDGGEQKRLYVLPLDAGGYVFHSVVTSSQEANTNVVFDVIPGKVTYIGDIVLDLETDLSVAGLTTIRGLKVWVRDAGSDLSAELPEFFPNGAPPVVSRPGALQGR